MALLKPGRVTGGAMVLGVVLATSGLGYCVTRLAHPASATRAVVASGPVPAAPAQPSTKPVPFVMAPTPALMVLRPPLLERGDHGPRVRELQSRLRQLAWFFGDVDDRYGPSTTIAVKGFQRKRHFPVTGYVDRRTLDRLVAMTHEPTADELANRFPGDLDTRARLDLRCLTGRALCIDKASSTVRWVVDGRVRRTLAVRFGASYSPTREGLFHVGWKSRDHVSKLYGSAMPYAMFFSGGQAVHYSSDFAARGYAGASHGCVNVRDLAGIRALFDEVSVGDKVVIYWS